MKPLAEFIASTDETDAAAFVANRPRYFLLKRPAGEGGGGPADLAPDLGAGGRTVALGAGAEPVDNEWRVEPLAAADANEDVIVTLGRGTQCDVVLPYRSVSKLHASLRIAPDSSLELCDEGSLNATVVNGKRIPSGDVVPVNEGDVIALGGVALEIVTSARLFEIIREHRSGK